MSAGDIPLWMQRGPQDQPVDVVRLREDVDAIHPGAHPAVVNGALLAVLTKLVESVQALHDRLDTLERAWRARGAL